MGGLEEGRSPPSPPSAPSVSTAQDFRPRTSLQDGAKCFGEVSVTEPQLFSRNLDARASHVAIPAPFPGARQLCLKRAWRQEHVLPRVV